MTVKIVDLYKGDRVLDFSLARAAGVLGIIHKATEGVTYTDTMYASRRTLALKAGMLWGAYHFGHKSPGPLLQLDHFLAVAVPDQNTLVCLDFERDERNINNTMTLEQAITFLDGLYTRVGRVPTLYGGGAIKDALQGKPNALLNKADLWLSQYSSKYTLPPGWKHYKFWQNTEHDKVPGIPGNDEGSVDSSIFDGTPEELTRAWAGLVNPTTTVTVQPVSSPPVAPVAVPRVPGPVAPPHAFPEAKPVHPVGLAALLVTAIVGAAVALWDQVVILWHHIF